MRSVRMAMHCSGSFLGWSYDRLNQPDTALHDNQSHSAVRSEVAPARKEDLLGGFIFIWCPRQESDLY